jgi:hypothetical protein
MSQMDDYFFTPMDETQLRRWERRRNRGAFVDIFLLGIVFYGLGTYILLTFLTLIFWHHHLDTDLFLQWLECFFLGPIWRAMDWHGYDKRYRMTLARTAKQTMA